MADDISQAAVTMPINTGEPEIGRGLQQTGVVAKSRISGISADGGAILSELIEKGILEEISPTEVRVSANKSLSEIDILGIAKDDFEKIWGILQQVRPADSANELQDDSEKYAKQPLIEETANIKADEPKALETSSVRTNLKDEFMGSDKISIEDNADKTGLRGLVSADKSADSQGASASAAARDKIIDAGKADSRDNAKAKPDRTASDKIKTEKVRELLMKVEKQIGGESSPRAGAERPGNTRISLPESSFSQPAATVSPLVTPDSQSSQPVATTPVALPTPAPSQPVVTTPAAPPAPAPSQPVVITPVALPTPVSSQPATTASPSVSSSALLPHSEATVTPSVMPATYADSGTVTDSEGLLSGDSEEDEGAFRDNDSSFWENDDGDEESEKDNEALFESDYPEEGISEDDSCPSCEKLNKKKNILEIKENIKSVTDRLFRSLDKAEQKSLVKERKEKFLELMENDPQAAIDSAISGPRRRGFSADIRKDVERIGDVEGVLETEYQCDLKRGTYKISYFIKDNGKKYKFYFSAGGSAFPLSGSRVKIRNGLILEDRVALDSVSADNFKIISSKKSSDIASRQKVAVILFNFNNDKRRPFTKSRVFKMLKSLRKFIKENSYGKLDLEFTKDDIYGWYTIESNTTSCEENDTGCVPAPDCNVSSVNGDISWRELAKNMAKADNEHPFPDKDGAYDKVFYIHPSAGCSYNGVAGIDEISMNGNVSGSVAAHEFGHTLGFNHAQNYVCTEEENDCTSARNSKCIEKYNKTAVSNYCMVEGYGDLYDVMGYGKGHYGVFNKMKMAWISAANMKTITADGSYEIKPIEDKSSEVQVLVIPRGERTIEDVKRYYYVEYRREYISKEGKSEGGIVVRLANADVTTKGETLLIDATPETISAKDAFLKKGEELRDDIAGVRIKVKDVSSGGAEVEVEVNQASSVCLEAVPGFSLKRSVPFSDCIKCGESIEYVLTVTNNDGIGCSGSDFEVTPELNGYLSQSPSSLTATIEPGDYFTENFVITLSEDANSLSNVYRFTETATDISSPSYSKSLTYTIFECKNSEVEMEDAQAFADEPIALLSRPSPFPPQIVDIKPGVPPVPVPSQPVDIRPGIPSIPVPSQPVVTIPVTPATPPPPINITVPPVTPGTPPPPVVTTAPPAVTPSGTPPPSQPIVTTPAAPPTPAPSQPVVTMPAAPPVPAPSQPVVMIPVTPGTPPPPINITASPVTSATPPPSVAITAPPAPVPSQPVVTMPAAPPAPVPSQPVVTTPAAPSTPVPSQPVVTTPVAPPTPVPSQPVVTMPVVPPTPVLSQPVVTTPAAPPAPVPSQPVVTAPAAPPAPVPSQPVVTTPAAPPAPVPSQPVVTAPAAPPTPVPSQPVVTAPAAPPTPVPSQPVVTTPARSVPHQTSSSSGGGKKK